MGEADNKFLFRGDLQSAREKVIREELKRMRERWIKLHEPRCPNCGSTWLSFEWEEIYVAQSWLPVDTMATSAYCKYECWSKDPLKYVRTVEGGVGGVP